MEYPKKFLRIKALILRVNYLRMFVNFWRLKRYRQRSEEALEFTPNSRGIFMILYKRQTDELGRMAIQMAISTENSIMNVKI